MLKLLQEAWSNRELIWALAVKDLRVRYKRSALGFLWALLNPLLMMVILTMVFSTLMRVPVHDYPIFLISTLLPWTFFSQSLAYSAESIVSNGELLKKVYVAKSVFPSFLCQLQHSIVSTFDLAALSFARFSLTRAISIIHEFGLP